jgi:hypothetical protein
MPKRFEARAASLGVGIIREKIVSSKLLVQLPQNSGARGKGNWPSEVGRLQYLAGYSISWCRDTISKRATKSKPNTRKATARAENWEVYSNHGLGRAKAWEGKRASFDLARAGTKPNLLSNSVEPGLVRPPRSRLAEAPFPPRRSRRSPPEASAQASDYRSPYLRIRMIAVSLREEPSHHNGVEQKALA